MPRIPVQSNEAITVAVKPTLATQTPWVPASESGLLLDLDAANWSPSQWTDASGRAHHALQSDAAKQFTRTTGLFNGRGAVRIASGQRMSLGALARTTNTTIAVYGRVNVSNASRCAVMLSGLGLFPGLSGNTWGTLMSGAARSSTFRNDMSRALILRSTSGSSNQFTTDGATTTNTQAGAYALSSVGSWIGSFDTSGTASFDGDIARVLVWDHVLSDDATGRVNNYLQQTYAQPLIVTAGNSLVHGFTAPSTSAPIDWMTSARHMYRWNHGLGGQTTAAMLTGAPTSEDIMVYPATPRSVYVYLEIRNDVVLGHVDADTAYNHYVSVAAARRAAGFLVIPTTPPASVSMSNVLRKTVVDRIRANWRDWADELADLAADPDMGQDGQNLNADLFIDGVHPTDAGNKIIARHWSDAVDRLLSR
jgi:hypothetical protein